MLGHVSLVVVMLGKVWTDLGSSAEVRPGKSR